MVNLQELALPVLFFLIVTKGVTAKHNNEGIQLYGDLDYNGGWIEVSTSSSATFDLMWEMDGNDPNRLFDFEIASDDQFTDIVFSYYNESISYAYYETADHSIFRDDPLQQFSLATGNYFYRVKCNGETDWETGNDSSAPSKLAVLQDLQDPEIVTFVPDELTTTQGNTVEQGDTITFTIDFKDDTVLNRATITANGEYAGIVGLKVTDSSHPNGSNKIWISAGEIHRHYFSYTTPLKGKTEPIAFDISVTDLVGNIVLGDTITIDVVKNGTLGGGGGPPSCDGESVSCSGKCNNCCNGYTGSGGNKVCAAP